MTVELNYFVAELVRALGSLHIDASSTAKWSDVEKSKQIGVPKKIFHARFDNSVSPKINR